MQDAEILLQPGAVGEVETPAHCPAGLRAFQALNQVDGEARRKNSERLRELAHQHGQEVELICSHDAPTLDRLLDTGSDQM